MGLTGKSIVYYRYWNHSSLNSFTWNVKSSYFLPMYQLRADILAGQFLAGDKGFRLDYCLSVCALIEGDKRWETGDRRWESEAITYYTSVQHCEHMNIILCDELARESHLYEYE